MFCSEKGTQVPMFTSSSKERLKYAGKLKSPGYSKRKTTCTSFLQTLKVTASGLINAKPTKILRTKCTWSE